MDLILASFDREFSVIDRHSRELLSKLDDHQLFQRPSGTAVSTAPFSCGACILRSAATIERTFGGLMTRLWDDPFEWTLPEKLSDKAAVLNYLDEVEATRSKGFGFFTSDADLKRAIPAPEKLRPLADILLEAVAHASHYQGRAFAIFQMLTAERPLAM